MRGGKTLCKFFKDAKCNKGDKCTFAHKEEDQNGEETLATVAFGLVAEEVETDKDVLKSKEEANLGKTVDEFRRTTSVSSRTTRIPHAWDSVRRLLL